ncbi:hypothetical protein L6452_36380 [Arctium lappa]|uniref:Uncharacterized protein n=1 Tax=Arctium lappa TaxID=4217 RepID=A0ACB8Y9R0_ARCLA|nr:hypothetical protein L6452_36380 [Arctium lappa]
MKSAAIQSSGSRSDPDSSTRCTCGSLVVTCCDHAVVELLFGLGSAAGEFGEASVQTMVNDWSNCCWDPYGMSAVVVVLVQLQ